MQHLVILGYTTNGRGRLFYEYVQASSDTDAVEKAVAILRAEDNEPTEYIVLAGSGSVHCGPSEVGTPAVSG